MPNEIIAAIIVGIAGIIAAFIALLSNFHKMKSSRKQSQISKGIVIKKSENFVGEVNELFLKAQKEVVIIGGPLSILTGSAEIVNNISKNKGIRVRLLALNVEKEALLSEYNKIANQGKRGVANLNHLKLFENNDYIEIRTYELMPTAYFIASDINASNGFIKAVHLFSGGAELDCPHIELNRFNEEWYEIYQRQIESLWDEGVPWRSHKG